jgi:hypothetical protein
MTPASSRLPKLSSLAEWTSGSDGGKLTRVTPTYPLVTPPRPRLHPRPGHSLSQGVTIPNFLVAGRRGFAADDDEVESADRATRQNSAVLDRRLHP